MRFQVKETGTNGFALLRMSPKPSRSIPENSLFTKPVNLLLETVPEQKLPKFFGFPATCRQSQATGQRRFDNFTLPQQISAASRALRDGLSLGCSVGVPTKEWHPCHYLSISLTTNSPAE